MQVGRLSPNPPEQAAVIQRLAPTPPAVDVAALLDRFPLEVVAHCFLKLPFPDRLNVSHVCRRWRRIALGIPRLWSTLKFHHHSKHRAVFSEIVARSGNAPLTVLWKWHPCEEEGLDLIVAHMSHVRTVDVGVRYELQGYLHPEEVDDEFPVVVAPLLERVRVATRRCLTILPAWSGDNAPRLRELLLDGFKLDPSCQPFRALRRFRGTPRAAFWDVRELLTLGPVLEDLELRAHRIRDIDYGLLCQWEGPIPRRIHLSHSADFAALFSFYLGRMAEPFGISCPSTAVAQEPGSQEPLPEFLTTLSCATRIEFSFDTCNRPAYINGLRDMAPSLSLLQLVHVECSAEVFASFLQRSPTLPSLETLALVPGGERRFADLNYCHFQHHGTLHAAALRVLTIDTTQLPPGGRLTGDLRMAALLWCTHTLPHTMHGWLQFDREKLMAVHMLVAHDSNYTADNLNLDKLLERVEKVSVLRGSRIASEESFQSDT